MTSTSSKNYHKWGRKSFLGKKKSFLWKKTFSFFLLIKVSREIKKSFLHFLWPGLHLVTTVLISWICKLVHGGHLEYEISWFSNLSRIIHQRVFRKKLRRSDEYWLLDSVRVDLKYVNKPMAAILDMQIRWLSNSSRIIHQRVFRKKIAKIKLILTTGERSPWSWICKLVHGGHLGYANLLIFEPK